MDKAKDSAAGSAVATGLRGVVAAPSSIGDVDGEKGELIYQGINIHDLATNSTFEEVVFLLWNGRLPKRAELDELRKNLSASYELPWQIIELIKGMYARVPPNPEPMDSLRTMVSGASDPHELEDLMDKDLEAMHAEESAAPNVLRRFGSTASASVEVPSQWWIDEAARIIGARPARSTYS